jgi:hypothetical protein
MPTSIVEQFVNLPVCTRIRARKASFFSNLPGLKQPLRDIAHSLATDVMTRAAS